MEVNATLWCNAAWTLEVLEGARIVNIVQRLGLQKPRPHSNQLSILGMLGRKVFLNLTQETSWAHTGSIFPKQRHVLHATRLV